MIVIQGAAQFVAAFLGTVAFSVLFSVPREQYPLCGTIGGFGWLICWICTNPFHMSAVTGSFIATVFIVTASRIGSTIRKCPVTLFPDRRHFFLLCRASEYTVPFTIP